MPQLSDQPSRSGGATDTSSAEVRALPSGGKCLQSLARSRVTLSAAASPTEELMGAPQLFRRVGVRAAGGERGATTHACGQPPSAIDGRLEWREWDELDGEQASGRQHQTSPTPCSSSTPAPATARAEGEDLDGEPTWSRSGAGGEGDGSGLLSSDRARTSARPARASRPMASDADKLFFRGGEPPAARAAP